MPPTGVVSALMQLPSWQPEQSAAQAFAACPVSGQPTDDGHYAAATQVEPSSKS